MTAKANRRRRRVIGRGVVWGVVLVTMTLVGGSTASDVKSSEIGPPTSLLPEDPFVHLSAIDPTEMADLRGGFVVNGVDMNFGATVRSFANGVLAMESTVNFTSAGAVTTNVTIPPGAADALGVTPEAIISGSGDLAGLTPDNVDLSALDQANGIVLNDPSGFSGFFHQINQDQVVSVLVSTANGQSFRQEVNFHATINNFQSLTDTIRSALFSHGLVRDVQPLN